MVVILHIAESEKSSVDPIMFSPSAKTPGDIILLRAMWDKLKILATSPRKSDGHTAILSAFGAAQVVDVPQGSQYITENHHGSTTHKTHHSG